MRSLLGNPAGLQAAPAHQSCKASGKNRTKVCMRGVRPGASTEDPFGTSTTTRSKPAPQAELFFQSAPEASPVEADPSQQQPQQQPQYAQSQPSPESIPRSSFAPNRRSSSGRARRMLQEDDSVATPQNPGEAGGILDLTGSGSASPPHEPSPTPQDFWSAFDTSAVPQTSPGSEAPVDTNPNNNNPWAVPPTSEWPTDTTTTTSPPVRPVGSVRRTATNPIRPSGGASGSPAAAPPRPTGGAPAASGPGAAAPSASAAGPASAAGSAKPAGSAGARVVRSARPTRNRMAATWENAAGALAGGAARAVAVEAPTQEQQTAVAGGPAWAQALFGNAGPLASPVVDDSAPAPVPQLQRVAPAPEIQQPDFEERDLPMQGFLELRSQEEELLVASRTVELPMLQSILDLTTAYKAPSRSLEAQAVEAAETTATTAAPVGRQLPNGVGTLADGTTYEKTSGEDIGPGGYWKRWTKLIGTNAEGTVTWEECWWEASDWAGLKELGAHKVGTSAGGGAWKEEWCEKAYHDPQTIEMVIERTAHKWARADDASGDEWEEKWGEKHMALGKVNKYADKWAKDGADVWHEKWGEDYDGRGGCLKYTDKWAEHENWGGSKDQWGDKWTENFADGKGTKHGEVWSIAANGERYNRWWNEHHLGDHQVRKYGNSNAGEYWDTVESMDTYYNPIPHFGFALAVRHSPGLMKVAELPRGRRASPAGDGSGSGSPGADVAGGAPQQEEEEDWQAMGLGGGLGALDWGDTTEEDVEEAQPIAPPSPTTIPTYSAASTTPTTPTPKTSPPPRPASAGPTASTTAPNPWAVVEDTDAVTSTSNSSGGVFGNVMGSDLGPAEDGGVFGDGMGAGLSTGGSSATGAGGAGSGGTGASGTVDTGAASVGVFDWSEVLKSVKSKEGQ